MPRDLDATMRAGQYADSFWVNRTGMTVEQLWAGYAEDLGRGAVVYP